MSTELSVNRPAFLQNLPPDAESGLEVMRGYTKPARLKIVQAQSKAPYKPLFKDGDIVIQNMLLKIGDESTPFSYTPIFCFPTWINITPYNLSAKRQDLPAVVEMSFDVNSELAKKAKKFVTTDPYYYIDKDTKEKKLVDGWKAKYQEQLNFLILLHDIDAVRNQPIHFWFSGGEYKYGQQFLSQLLSRHSQYNAPIYANRFRASSIGRIGTEGNWFGWDIKDDVQPFIDDSQFETFKKLHYDLKKALEDKTLEIDSEDTERNTVDPATSKF